MKPGMHVGLDDQRAQVAAGVEEPDAVVVDLERAADLAEHVEERRELALPRALDRDVAARRQRRTGPRRGLDPVRDRGVRVATEPVDALDPHRPVGVDADHRAHLLQHVDQVHDLGLGGRVAQLGESLGADRGQQDLLGGPDTRVGQLELGALQPARRAEPQPVRALLDDGTERAQDVEVVVDRPLADPAATEVGDERLAEPVQQRTAEQDRDPARAGVRVDVGHVGLLDVARVQQQLAASATGRRSPAALDATVTLTPCSSSSPDTIATSEICGTPRSRDGSSPSSAATIALDTRFLAPRTCDVPCSGVPPWTVIRSGIGPGSQTLVAGNGEPRRAA